MFFINTGANLHLDNVSVQRNTVKGGEGGSTPDVNVSGASLTLIEKTSDVSSVTAFQIKPTVIDVGGTLKVTGATLGSSNPLIKTGGVISLAGGTSNTTIDTLSGNNVTFSQQVTIDPASIKTLNAASLSTGTNTVTSSNFNIFGNADVVLGMTVVGNGIPDGTTITQITRDSSNGVTSITLSNNVTSTTSTTLRLVDVTSFQASQFQTPPELAANQIKLSATGLGLAVGMTLSGAGVPSGTTVTAISGDVVTLSQPITGLSFTGTLPIGAIGQNQIQLAVADSRFTVGSVVTGSGIPPNTTITAVDSQTGKLTLSNALTQVPTELSTQSVLSQSGNTLQLKSTAGLQVGMVLESSSIPGGTQHVSARLSGRAADTHQRRQRQRQWRHAGLRRCRAPHLAERGRAGAAGRDEPHRCRCRR